MPAIIDDGVYQRPKTPGGVDPKQTTQEAATAAVNSGTPQDRVIPGAGVYGQRQANAELAYQNARAQAEARKNSMYHQYGLTSKGEVDQKNQYGRYQQMLGEQGFQLDQADESAIERGLGGGPGLGNQAERMLRYGHSVQNLGFQRDVNQIGTDYGIALGDAEVARRNAMTDALQAALGDAWGDWTPPDMSSPTTTSTGAAKKAPVASKQPSWIARAKKAGYSGVGGVTPAKPKPTNKQPAWIARAKKAGYGR